MKKRWLVIAACLCLLGAVIFGFAASASETKATAETVKVTFHIGQGYDDLVLEVLPGTNVYSVWCNDNGHNHWLDYTGEEEEEGVFLSLEGFVLNGHTFTTNAEIFAAIDEEFYDYSVT